MPTVSVIVPVRNEARIIGRSLSSLLTQDIPASDYEVIVVDGMSDDDSKGIVRKLQREHSNLVLLTNPSIVMPCGMNIGLRHAQSPIIVVAGAHTSYPSGYLRTCLSWLEQTGADVVGGPLVTVAGVPGFRSGMIAAILSSRFGVGNADFRTGLKEGWVDTVPYGAYRKGIFERCGLYNESLVRAQDCELHARIRHSGGRIYQTPALLTYYHPVSSFGAFCYKAFLDGLWQCFATIVNPHSFSSRRFVPVAMVVLLSALVISAILIPSLWKIIVGFISIYFATGVYFGTRHSGRSRLLTRLSLPLFAFPFHVCYGAGTLAGLWHVLREPARSR